jgi:hypothetical protein
MKKSLFLILPLCLAACEPRTGDVLKTQLQVREFQTRTFDTANTNEVLTAVVEAFQDQGFMVKNVVPQVGLVSATKEVDIEDTGQAMLKTLFLGNGAAWRKNTVLEATANVKTTNGKTKVRANFQEKVLSNLGTLDTVNTLEDPKFYQNFFDKIGKSIFFEKNKM